MNLNMSRPACGDPFQQHQTRNNQQGAGPAVDCRPLLFRVCSHTPYCIDCFQRRCASNIQTKRRWYPCPLCRVPNALDKNKPVVNEVMCAMLGMLSAAGGSSGNDIDAANGNANNNANNAGEEAGVPCGNRQEEINLPSIPPAVPQIVQSAWNVNKSSRSEGNHNPETTAGDDFAGNPSPINRSQLPLEVSKPKRQRVAPAYYGRSPLAGNYNAHLTNRSDSSLSGSEGGQEC